MGPYLQSDKTKDARMCAGVGIGEGMGAGGGNPYRSAFRKKKNGQGCRQPRAHELWHRHGHGLRRLVSLPPSFKQVKKK